MNIAGQFDAGVDTRTLVYLYHRKLGECELIVRRQTMSETPARGCNIQMRGHVEHSIAVAAATCLGRSAIARCCRPSVTGRQREATSEGTSMRKLAVAVNHCSNFHSFASCGFTTANGSCCIGPITGSDTKSASAGTQSSNNTNRKYQFRVGTAEFASHRCLPRRLVGRRGAAAT